MSREEELHTQIMKLLRDYYTANQKWETRHTYRSGIAVRAVLTKLRHVARERKKELLNWHNDMYPSSRFKAKIKQKDDKTSQDYKGEDTTRDN